MGNLNFLFVLGSTSITYVICLVSLITVSIIVKNVFNVLSYGASGSDITDDSLPFMKAENDSSAASGPPTMIIPEGKLFLMLPVKFRGPCKSNAINVKEFFTIFIILCIVTQGLGSATNSFNVMNYGAVGDGRTDDSAAFLKAWKAVCKAPSRNASLIIPANKTFLLKPVTFSGPCKSSSINVLISGNIVAPNSKFAWKGYHINRWLAFTNVNGLMITGSGTINGRGSAWWSQPCLHKVAKGVTCKGPTALTLYRCNSLVLKGLRHINSQRNHITISHCKGVTISNLHISAPRTSHNTDGIDISSSSNIQIRNSSIGTGDDCIAISSGSSHINITGIACGPGHGISIGALGVHGENDTVEEVHVRNCTFNGTMTGVRIKTWQGGVGYARKISFEKIRLIRAGSPIIIDQYYCPGAVKCKNETSAIKISDVSYSSIVGTSSTDKVINLSCDQNVGCSNIQLHNVDIKSTVPRKKAYSYCFNAHGKQTHTSPAVLALRRWVTIIMTENYQVYSHLGIGVACYNFQRLTDEAN